MANTYLAISNFFPPAFCPFPQGRNATEAEKKQQGGCVLKDNDFVAMNTRLSLGPTLGAALTQQIAADVALLERLNIMDYSMLLGIHDTAARVGVALPAHVLSPNGSHHAGAGAGVAGAGAAAAAAGAGTGASGSPHVSGGNLRGSVSAPAFITTHPNNPVFNANSNNGHNNNSIGNSNLADHSASPATGSPYGPETPGVNANASSSANGHGNTNQFATATASASGANSSFSLNFNGGDGVNAGGDGSNGEFVFNGDESNLEAQGPPAAVIAAAAAACGISAAHINTYTNSSAAAAAAASSSPTASAALSEAEAEAAAAIAALSRSLLEVVIEGGHYWYLGGVYYDHTGTIAAYDDDDDDDGDNGDDGDEIGRAHV